MIVKILAKSASFQGVGYNTGKIDKNKGELMRVANFGPLQGLTHLRPEDYKNYLKMLSAQNKRVSQPQFHATISAPGNTVDKNALTEIAAQWLEKMGYGSQPYLIVFHKDTRNNHVHMVSTRIDRNGKKINSGFENIRAIQNLNKVMGLDEKHNAVQDVEKALAYSYSTKAQFMMILESQGYSLKEFDGKLFVIKFGEKQSEIDLAKVQERINNAHFDQERISQLKAIFHKYGRQVDTVLTPIVAPLPGGNVKKSNGFTSEFSALLKETLGISLIYHASGDKPPYGYTVIDHAGKAVFKGGEIMPLKELLEMPVGKRYADDVQQKAGPDLPGLEMNEQPHSYYAAILKAALYNYPDFIQGLHHQGLTIIRNGADFILIDQNAGFSVNTEDILTPGDHRYMVENFSQAAEQSEGVGRQYIRVPDIYIAPDVDDEAIHGRNRRRKRKAHTNSR